LFFQPLKFEASGWVCVVDTPTLSSEWPMPASPPRPGVVGMCMMRLALAESLRLLGGSCPSHTV
jgi:hypothetical protein